MEPFWFFAGIVVMLPMLQRVEEPGPVAPKPATVRASRVLVRRA
jgi:hypothetical protein